MFSCPIRALMGVAAVFLLRRAFPVFLPLLLFPLLWGSQELAAVHTATEDSGTPHPVCTATVMHNQDWLPSVGSTARPPASPRSQLLRSRAIRGSRQSMIAAEMEAASSAAIAPPVSFRSTPPAGETNVSSCCRVACGGRPVATTRRCGGAERCLRL